MAPLSEPPPAPTICRVLLMTAEAKKHYTPPSNPTEAYALNDTEAVIVNCGVLYKPEAYQFPWQVDPTPTEIDFSTPPIGIGKVVPRPISLCKLKDTFFNSVTGEILITPKDFGLQLKDLSPYDWQGTGSYSEDGWRVFKTGHAVNCPNTVLLTYQEDLCKPPEEWDSKFYMDTLNNACACLNWGNHGLCPITDIKLNFYDTFIQEMATAGQGRKNATIKYDHLPLRQQSTFLGGNGLLNGDRFVYSRRLMPMKEGLRPIEFRYHFVIADRGLHSFNLNTRNYLHDDCVSVENKLLIQRGLDDISGSFVTVNMENVGTLLTPKLNTNNIKERVKANLDTFWILSQGGNNGELNAHAAESLLLSAIKGVEIFLENMDAWKNASLTVVEDDNTESVYNFDTLKIATGQVMQNLKSVNGVAAVFNNPDALTVVTQILAINEILQAYSYYLSSELLGNGYALDNIISTYRAFGYDGHQFLQEEAIKGNLPAQVFFTQEYLLAHSLYIKDILAAKAILEGGGGLPNPTMAVAWENQFITQYQNWIDALIM